LWNTNGLPPQTPFVPLRPGQHPYQSRAQDPPRRCRRFRWARLGPSDARRRSRGESHPARPCYSQCILRRHVLWLHL